jgi:hypothetical protein
MSTTTRDAGLPTAPGAGGRADAVQDRPDDAATSRIPGTPASRKGPVTKFGMVSLVAVAVACVAEPSAAATVERSSFKGSSAYAQFNVDDGCTSTGTSVLAYDNVENRQRLSAISYIIYRFDNCSGVILTSISGNADLADTNFVVRAGARNATLVAEIDTVDNVSGTPIHLEIRLSWSAAGQELGGVAHNSFQVPGYRSMTTSKGISREATAIGTVSDGQTNYTPDPSFYALISDSSSGSVTITKP